MTGIVAFEEFRRLLIQARKWNVGFSEYVDPETDKSRLAVRFWGMPARVRARGRMAWAAFDPATGKLVRASEGDEAPTEESLAVARAIAAGLVPLGVADLAKKALRGRRAIEIAEEPIRLAENGTLTVGIRQDLPPDIWESAARTLYGRYRAGGG